VKSQSDGGAPDIQVHFSTLSIARGSNGPTLPPRKLMCAVPSVNHPKSRGTVELRSANPSDAPLIKPRLLDHRDDVATLGRGVRLCEKILRTSPIAEHVVEFLNPPPPASDPQAFEAYLREFAAPLYHPVGTCRMGGDPDAVVDAALKVVGVDGLFVADASIMPTHISGNTHAAAMMIGEKAADLISEST
jgi:choline dehydrogenase